MMPDDRPMPRLRDTEFIRMVSCLAAAAVNSSMDIVLMSLLWANFIVAGAAVATFFIVLPLLLGSIVLYLALRKGWGRELLSKPIYFFLPIGPILLDSAALIMLPYLYLSSRNLSIPCK